MDTLEVAPQVLAGRGVSFSLPGPQGIVECVVTIRALQDCFWLEPHADDIRILRAFRDGYGRIRAIAERKVLAHLATHLELTTADFARPLSCRHANNFRRRSAGGNVVLSRGRRADGHGTHR